MSTISMLSMSSLFTKKESGKSLGGGIEDDQPAAFDDEEESTSRMSGGRRQQIEPEQAQMVKRVTRNGRPEWIPWSPNDTDDDEDYEDQSKIAALERFDQGQGEEPSATGGSSVNDVSEEQAMTEDIYSLMSTVGVCSVSFGFAVWTFIAQAAVTCLVFLDLVVIFGTAPTTNGTTNRMLIPVDVPMTVTAAQFFAVGLIVNFAAAQGDLLVGFSHLIRGFDPDIHTQNPHVTRFKWYVAGILQFFVGAVLVADLAVLLMQSTSNIMLCLNFAALHFVQDIDDVSFSMGAMGLINRQVQKDCEAIGDIMVKRRSTRRQNIYKRVFLFCLAVGLYAYYFMVTGWQWTGRFMCHSLHIQFGDDFGKEWPHYSSVFVTHGTNMGDRTEGRAVYVDPTNTMRLAYCGGERAWTFSYVEDDDHCNYFIKSTETWSFDVMDIAPRTWYAQHPDLGEVPMDFLSVTCNDCDDEICSSEQGVCIDNQCVCNEGRMGVNCEFWDDDEHLCEFMALDRRSKGDVSALAFASVFMRKTYRRLKVTPPDGNNITQIYNRPFYISAYSGNRSMIETFIVFSGYRWIMYGLPQEAPREVTIADFENFLIETEAHEQPLEALRNISRLFDFIPLFFSGPTQYETRSHDVDPLTARWVLAATDKSLPLIGAYPDIDAPVSASFLCTKCHNETNPCLNNGVCGGPNVQHKTQCDCNATGIKSYGGFMCEYAYGCDERPELAGNGCECDPIFKICTKCNPGYYGNLCQFHREIEDGVVEIQLDGGIADGHFICENTECQNGGYCKNSVEWCQCPPEWKGPYCEIPAINATTTIEVFVCSFSTCKNGGVCNNSSDACLCPQNYTGDTCEDFVGGAEDFISMISNETSHDVKGDDEVISMVTADLMLQDDEIDETDNMTTSRGNDATSSPTVVASNSPTISASNAPTFVASNSPTHVTSNAPTVTASNAPTLTASNPLSNSPTNEPTETPSNGPTDTPTNKPTVVPTISPTELPSKTPTVVPTNSPSNASTEDTESFNSMSMLAQYTGGRGQSWQTLQPTPVDQP